MSGTIIFTATQAEKTLLSELLDECYAFCEASPQNGATVCSLLEEGATVVLPLAGWSAGWRAPPGTQVRFSKACMSAHYEAHRAQAVMRVQSEAAEERAARLEAEGAGALSRYFGLSYASWLTQPRVVLEAMPGIWQGELAELLEELDLAADKAGLVGPTTVVTVKGENGRWVKDSPWHNYRHPAVLGVAISRLRVIAKRTVREKRARRTSK